MMMLAGSTRTVPSPRRCCVMSYQGRSTGRPSRRVCRSVTRRLTSIAAGSSKLTSARCASGGWDQSQKYASSGTITHEERALTMACTLVERVLFPAPLPPPIAMTLTSPAVGGVLSSGKETVTVISLSRSMTGESRHSYISGMWDGRFHVSR